MTSTPFESAYNEGFKGLIPLTDPVTNKPKIGVVIIGDDCTAYSKHIRLF